MKHLLIVFLLIPAMARSQRFQLAPPQIRVDSFFFRQSARVTMEFDLDGASIHYSTNFQTPTDSTPLYQKPVVLNESATIRARAFHPDYAAGPVAEQHVVKVKLAPDSVVLLTPPDSLYPGKKNTALFDLQKGSRNLKDGAWLGFRADTVVVQAFFKQTVSCRLLQVSTLFDSGAWIFPPARVEVYGASGDKEWQYLGAWMPREGATLQDRPAQYELFEKVVLRPAQVQRLEIRVIPFGPLPQWHAGSGKPAWLFLDEIILQ